MRTSFCPYKIGLISIYNPSFPASNPFPWISEDRYRLKPNQLLPEHLESMILMDFESDKEDRPPQSYIKAIESKLQFQGRIPHLISNAAPLPKLSPFFEFQDSPASPELSPNQDRRQESRIQESQESFLQRLERLSLRQDDSEIQDSGEVLTRRRPCSEPLQPLIRTSERVFKVIYSTEAKPVSETGILRVLPYAGVLELLTPSGVRVTHRNAPPDFSLDPGTPNLLGPFSVEIRAETTKRDSIAAVPPPKPEGLFLDTGIFVPGFLTASLRPHQREGVKFMYDCVSGLRGGDVSGCILADSMGLGKTLQVIALVYTLISKEIAKKIIITMPKTLINNWKAEFEKWVQGRLDPVEFEGRKSDQIAQRFCAGRIPVLLVSYEMLMRHIDKLRTACDLLVCDEGHKLKNSSSLTTKALDSIFCKRRILVTGTPLQNNLKEFFTCIKFANQRFACNTWPDFEAEFARPIVLGHRPGASEHAQLDAERRNADLQQITSAFILRRTSELLNLLLPPRHEFLVFLRLTEMQEAVYLMCLEKSHCGAMLKGKELNKEVMGWAFALISLLRKVVNHPKIIQKSTNLSEELTIGLRFLEVNWFDLKLSSKLIFLDALLRHTVPIGDKTLIASSYKQTLSILEEYCQQMEISYVRMDGDTPPGDRLRLVNEFNKSPKTQVFLLSTKAGGCGLNLVGANRLVIFDPDWNPSTDKQVMGRIWRDGQTKEVFIYRLFSSGTLEEKIHQLQVEKAGLFATVVDAQKRTPKFSTEQLKAIFTYTRKCETYNDPGDLNTTRFQGSFLSEMRDLVELVKEQREDCVVEESIDFSCVKEETDSKPLPVQTLSYWPQPEY